MEANRAQHRWTYEEYARLPQPSEAQGTRFEVIDGALFVTPSPSLSHQRVVIRLATLLHGFVQEHRLGEVLPGPLDVLFGEGDYVEPDIVFVRSGRDAILTRRGIEGPPDLIAEVLSPSTSARDRGIKLDRYRLFGVTEYWVVDPDERRVEVWRFAAGASEPLVLGAADTLRWQPVKGDSTLDIAVMELFPSP
jgi:Uma2 family endonuclease